MTRFQVRDVRQKLIDELGLEGLTDPQVRFLDPACGTGTYLLALAEEAKAEAAQRGLPVQTTLRELFRDRVVGFEVSPGPAAVAQARLTAWLRDEGIRLGSRFPIYTVNTLTPPAQPGGRGGYPSLWAEHISLEQQAGDAVKRDQPVLVVFGNPPWGDRPKKTLKTGPRDADNWIVDWSRNVGAAVINLYDLYVAFWRFACWMLLERPGVQDARGIVSFITNRSWLRGRAYGVMRQWLRRHRVAAEIIDLGGDIRAGATHDDQPVFAIKAGSAISTLTFGGRISFDGGKVSFRRLRGARAEKLRRLREGDLPAAVRIEPRGDSDSAKRKSPFGEVDWGPLKDAPTLRQFFANHYPGVKTHRDQLVIDCIKERLSRRLQEWASLTGEARSAAFKESRDRRSPSTHAVDEALVMLHRYRPLDNRFLYGSRTFIDQPGRIFGFYEGGLRTKALLSMDTRTESSPVVLATDTLPGYNSFRGSYETHAFPLSAVGQLDDDSLSPAARRWANTFSASTEDVAAYILALGNAPLYGETFKEAMEAEMVRFPATLDAGVFSNAVVVGKRLLDAWTLSAPMRGEWEQNAPGRPLGEPHIDGADLMFSNGDRLKAIHPDSFELEVSSHAVLPEFLTARADLELTSDLEAEIRRVVGAVWVILEERAVCDALLERAIGAPMMAL